MTNPLERIESHPHEAKRLIGIEYEHFLALVDLAEQKHLNKQKLKKTKFVIGGGRRPDMSSKQGICLCLVYLRQKPIFEILGLLFDVSKTKANDAFNYWIEILRYTASISNGRSRTDEAKYQKLRQSLLGYELIVDSAEQPVQRPVDYQEKKYYSGKKKMHTFKNQFIVLPNGEDIVDVIVGKLGKTSDINLFRASRDKLTPNKGFR